MTDSKPTIAIIEDSADLRGELSFFFQRKGYLAWGAGSAEEFWKQLHVNRADIVLVDIGLPGEDGFKVVSHLKKMSNFGVIIISARGSHEDSLRGLESGADLYLIKPLSFAHLISSIDALWHRMLHSKITPLTKFDRRTDDTQCWKLDNQTQTLVAPAGETLKLSRQEYNLVAALIESPQEVFSKETLHSRLFQFEEDAEDHRIDVILNRLRKKARTQNFKLPIHSIFGRGVVFTGQVTD